MGDAQLEEAQAGIKTAERNVSNLKHADDTTLMAESEEELKSLLMSVKEESEKAGLKLKFKKLRSWLLVSLLQQIEGVRVETVTDFVASLVAQWSGTCLPTQKSWVQSLGQEDPWRRKWPPSPVFLPGKSHGQRSLAGCGPWGHRVTSYT